MSTATATDGPSSFLGTTYVNGGHVKARGLELEAQARLGHGPIHTCRMSSPQNGVTLRVGLTWKIPAK